jgi:hypothetical protein
MRPSGVGGVLLMLVVAWIGVALIAWGALALDRWFQVSYPDSLWLFVAIGVVAVAPAVGRVSRTPRDADAWGSWFRRRWSSSRRSPVPVVRPAAAAPRSVPVARLAFPAPSW